MHPKISSHQPLGPAQIVQHMLHLQPFDAFSGLLMRPKCICCRRCSLDPAGDLTALPNPLTVRKEGLLPPLHLPKSLPALSLLLLFLPFWPLGCTRRTNSSLRHCS